MPPKRATARRQRPLLSPGSGGGCDGAQGIGAPLLARVDLTRAAGCSSCRLRRRRALETASHASRARSSREESSQAAHCTAFATKALACDSAARRAQGRRALRSHREHSPLGRYATREQPSALWRSDYTGVLHCVVVERAFFYRETAHHRGSKACVEPFEAVESQHFSQLPHYPEVIYTCASRPGQSDVRRKSPSLLGSALSCESSSEGLPPSIRELHRAVVVSAKRSAGTRGARTSWNCHLDPCLSNVERENRRPKRHPRKAPCGGSASMGVRRPWCVHLKGERASKGEGERGAA